MNTLEIILVLIFYVFSPTVILYLCHRYTFVNKLGAVLIAYIVGIIVGNTGWLQGDEVYKLQEILMSVTIPLAIPLILYSSDIKKSFQLARNTFMSLVTALIALVVVVVIGYLLFRTNNYDSYHKIAGLLVGVYTGGTPNLAALKMVLNIEPSMYLLVHTYDMLLSTLHLFFLMIAGKKVFELVLPKFKTSTKHVHESDIQDATQDPYGGVFKKENRQPLLKALGVTIVIAALGGGLMLLFPIKSQMAVFILSITALAVVASNFKSIRSIPKTYEFGMYLILVFSVVVASKADYRTFSEINYSVLNYVSFTVIGSMILHVALARIFKIDADTIIITSTALVCSPPFVPVVAEALKNKSMIIPGITIGIVGYAIGNFLGFVVSELLLLL